MRPILLVLVGAVAAETAAASEMYSFTTVVNKQWWYQTLVYCERRVPGRVPVGCILSEPAIGYPNIKHTRSQPGVRCAASHPISFHKDGTLAYCKLDGEQHFELAGPPISVGSCLDYAYFDENGLADCD